MEQFGYPDNNNSYPQYRPMFKDRSQYLQDLGAALRGEAEAIAFYTALLGLAPDERANDYISHILEDERSHYRAFSNLHYQLTGKHFKVPIPSPPELPNYGEALITAFEDELDAAHLYKGMYLNSLTAPLRDIAFDIMTDEIEHANRLSLLYTKSRELESI